MHKIDILLVSETHFTERTHFKINKYKVYTTQHPDETAHGGSAIIINEKIDHYELEKYEEESMQGTQIKVQEANGPLVVAAVYCPPKHKLKKEHFETYFNKLGNRFVAGGDFNSKHTTWGSRIDTTNKRELLKAINSNNYKTVSTGEPTYWATDPNKMPDLLNFFVTSGVSPNYFSVASNYDLSSDHSPVIGSINSIFNKKVKYDHLTNKNTDWVKFRQFLEQNISMFH